MTMTRFLLFILFLGIIYFGWMTWKFLKYRVREKGDKNSIYYRLSEGLTLNEAIEKEFSDLNKFSKIGLTPQVIKTVANEIANLEERMTVDNVIEIYSTFIYRYIFRNGQLKNPSNLDETKILRVIYSLEFIEKDGYFVIKPDNVIV